MEFARLFPSVVEDYLVRIRKLPCKYYTQPKTFYETMDEGDFPMVDLPKIPKDEAIIFLPEEIVTVQEYRKAYL